MSAPYKARCQCGAVTATIAPTRVAATDAWSHVHGANNRVVVESTSAGALIFEGAGAGGRATAGAVLSDLVPATPVAATRVP